MAVNCCACSGRSETAAGDTVTPTVASSVTVALADFDVSATLVAVTVTVCAVPFEGAT